MPQYLHTFHWYLPCNDQINGVAADTIAQCSPTDWPVLGRDKTEFHLMFFFLSWHIVLILTSINEKEANWFTGLT